MKAKKVLLLLTLAIILSSLDVACKRPIKTLPENYDFKDYEKEFKKNYEDEESRGKHMKAFNERLRQLRKLSKEYEGTTEFAVNELTDITST